MGRYFAIVILALLGCKTDPDTTGETDGGAGEGGAGSVGGIGGSERPAVPGELTLWTQLAPHGVVLDWEPAGDVVDYVVLRDIDGTLPVLEDGSWYAARDSVGDDARVVAVATETEAFDAAPDLYGSNHFAVYARDSGGRYSEPAAASIEVPLPAQLGTITIVSPTSKPVVEVKQPSHIKLAVDATYDATTAQLALAVAVNNQTGRMAFNTKLVVESLNDGAAISDGVVGGKPMIHYGTRGIADADWGKGSLGVTAVSADPLVIEVSLRSDPTLMIVPPFVYGYPDHAFFVDSSGALDTAGFAVTQSLNSGGFEFRTDGGLRTPVISRDGRFAYCAQRNLASVVQFDMTTLAPTLSANLASGTGRGFIGSVSLSPKGEFLLVWMVSERHRHTGSMSTENWVSAPAPVVELVKMQLPELVELARVTLDAGPAPDVSAFPIGEQEWNSGTQRLVPSQPAFSPDGSLVAVPDPWASGLWLVDVDTMSIVDADDRAAGVQSIDLCANAAAPRAAIFHPDGATIYVAHHADDSTLSVVDVATLQPSAIDMATQGTARWRGWTFTSDTELVMARREGNLSLIDLMGRSSSTLLSGNMAGVVHDPTTQRYFALESQSSTIFVFDAAEHLQIDTDGEEGNGVTPLRFDDSAFNYALVSGTYDFAITPF